MADNNFRSDRSRDPLAELARLIGQAEPHQADRHQADPYAESEPRQSYGSERSGGHVDWTTEESYGARDSHVDERYPERHAPAASYRSQAPQERRYEQEPSYEQDQGYEQDRVDEQDHGYQQHDQSYESDAPAAGRYFSGPAAQFNGFREEPDAYEYEEPPQLPPARQLHQDYAAAPDHGYETDEPEQYGNDAYAADEYDDEAPSPRRRSGLVLVMAIFGLAVVGTAGAFGYRAMFGGSVLPTLPPIIKASNGPNRVAPAYGDSQANDASDAKQAGAGATGSAENLVSREEQPVTIEPPKSAPRVVSTIPVITSPGSGQPMPQGAMPPGLTAGNQAAPGRVASAADPLWPPPPQIGPPPPSTPVVAPMPASAPPPQVSAEPKKIHTVTIHADQSDGADAAAAPASPPAARPQSRPATVARTNAPPPSGPNAPMSIVPGSRGAMPAPQNARVTTAPTTVASTSAVPASGGYAVQVTSQRSESEAQTAFRTLQAKYPNQLSGRAPIIRRADLGEKGTYYRAMVGPFASAEEAAGLCSGLKAAGGNCIVQRN
jgi:sporulation related protein